MPQRKTEFSPEADADLEEIGDFIAQDNPVRALSFVVELRRRCADLADFPEAHPIYIRKRGKALRKAVHGNYLILYEVRPTLVWIVRILHGARNIRRLL